MVSPGGDDMVSRRPTAGPGPGAAGAPQKADGGGTAPLVFPTMGRSATGIPEA